MIYGRSALNVGKHKFHTRIAKKTHNREMKKKAVQHRIAIATSLFWSSIKSSLK